MKRQARPTKHVKQARHDFVKQAVSLLSQELWCLGRDIVRPEGNWLLEIGFHRTRPPAERQGCSSVYSLDLSVGRSVLLRGFGVFYGDSQHGGVFLPRYDFIPQYTSLATLDGLPWTPRDLSSLTAPTVEQLPHCTSLVLDLVNWLQAYEEQIVDRLGIEYRRSSLAGWDNGERLVTPAAEMARAWQNIGGSIAEGSFTLV